MASRKKAVETRPKELAKRVRRSPEEARALILDAADRVFSQHLPDAAGLKEVAREAGVSHALVTHYFKTYAGLVEATLERRFARLRAMLMGELFVVIERTKEGGGTTADLLAAYREGIKTAASDQVTVRLATWAMMSGFTAQEDFFTHRVQGLRLLADALEQRTDVAREDLEFCLVASFALTVVWTVGGSALAGALGRKKTASSGAAFDGRVARMIDAYLASAKR